MSALEQLGQPEAASLEDDESLEKEVGKKMEKGFLDVLKMSGIVHYSV